MLLTAVVVLVVAWEAPTTKAGGWPHERISGVSRMRYSCGSSVVIGVVSVVP